MSSTSRVWFVTGSSSGLGRALVEEVIASGDRVVAGARNPSALADLAARAPDSILTPVLDVTRPETIGAAVAEAEREWGGVDVLVNNAGAGLLGAVEECSDADARGMLELNFFGPVNVLREFLPRFRQRRSGHILQMGAAAAIANYPGFGFYGASKAAISALMESLAQEVKPLGVRVTLVEPGPFRTDFIGRSMARAATRLPDYAGTSGRFAQYLDRINGRQPGDPLRAAAALVRLVHSGEAPLRFPLGRYVIDKTRKTFAQRERELVQHEAAGAGADGEPAR